MGLMSLVLRTGTLQLLVQAIGFAGGILVIRLLPIDEYATYTVLLAALGTLTALADPGISSTVMARSGSHTADRARSSRILLTGMAQRRRFSLWVGALALPVLLTLLQRQGAPLGWAALGVCGVALAFFLGAATPLLEVPFKMQQTVMPLQWAQVQANALRVALVGLALWMAPIAVLALLAAALTQWWLNARLRSLLGERVDWRAADEPETALAIRGNMRRTLPGALYYCVAGQLNVWLLALFGNTASVAQIGALGRLAMLFTIVQATVAMIVLPRFARQSAVRSVLLRAYLKVCAALVVLTLALTLLALLFPQELLWILGAPYRSLETEVALMALNGGLGLVGGALFAMNNVRGYLPPAWLPPALGVSHTVALMFLLDVSTVHGVLLMQAILAGFTIFYATLIFLFHAHRSR
jgi:O-antigen/teichoic acid export membrane protein